jgi:hypothetical protein
MARLIAAWVATIASVSAWAATIDGVAVKGMVPVPAKEMAWIKSLTVSKALAGEEGTPCLVIAGTIVSNIKDWDCNVILSITVCPLVKPSGGILFDAQPTKITIRKPAFGTETKFAAVIERPGVRNNPGSKVFLDPALGYTVGVHVTRFEPPPLHGDRNPLDHGKIAPADQ